MNDGSNGKDESGSEKLGIIRATEQPQGPREGIEEAYERWLNPIAWQIWATATFPWNVRAETADAKFKELLDIVEGTLKCRVCCAWARENQSRTRVDAVGEHFHFQMAARQPIPLDLICSEWRRLVHRSGNPSDDSIEADPYDPARGGLAYTFKHVGSGASEPDYHNLEYFHPDLQPRHDRTRRPQRSLRRWNEERQRSARIAA